MFAIIDCDGLLFLCDIEDFLDNNSNWTVGEGGNTDDLLDFLEEQICDWVQQCEYEVEIEVGDFACSRWAHTLTADVTGGRAPYTFQWETPGFPAIPVVDWTFSSIYGYEEGTYEVMVTDAYGCVESASIFISIPDPLSVNIGEDIEICDFEEIEIYSDREGGTAPYSYLWSDHSTWTSTTVDGADGDQVVSLRVTDGQGCTTNDEINVNVIERGVFTFEVDSCALRLDVDFEGQCYSHILEMYSPESGEWISFGNFISGMLVPYEYTQYRVRNECRCYTTYSNEIYTTLCVPVNNCSNLGSPLSGNSGIYNYTFYSTQTTKYLFRFDPFTYPDQLIIRVNDSIVINSYPISRNLHQTEVDSYFPNCPNIVGLDPKMDECVPSGIVPKWDICVNAYDTIHIKVLGSPCSHVNLPLSCPITTLWNLFISCDDCEQNSGGGQSLVSSQPISETTIPFLENTNETSQSDGLPTFSILPNPANSYIDLLSNRESDDKMEIKIFTITGEVVQSISFDTIKDSQRINVGDLLEGLYLIRIQSDDFHHTEKIIIARN